MKLNSDTTDYAKEIEMWKHTVVSQRCQPGFALCPPVQENIAAARSKPLSQGEGRVALHPTIFGKEILYWGQNDALKKKLKKQKPLNTRQ